MSGKWLKVAAIKDEEFMEGESIPDPKSFLSRMWKTGLKADIITFAQKLPDAIPRYEYHLERDSLAVISITSFSDWWEKRAKKDVRSAVNKAARLGIVVRQAEFNDSFVEGIVAIYNESAFRQGKPFWHYKKDFNTVKHLNSTYLERSTFIGAFYKDELVGFIRMVSVGSVAMTLQVISMKKHSGKKPTNALIAKAVEICTENRMSYLVYGNYVYQDPKASLTEFKRRNGFEEFLIPRYYVPLTLKGRIALRLKLHHGIAEMLPHNVLRVLSRVRKFVWKFRNNQN